LIGVSFLANARIIPAREGWCQVAGGKSGAHFEPQEYSLSDLGALLPNMLEFTIYKWIISIKFKNTNRLLYMSKEGSEDYTREITV